LEATGEPTVFTSDNPATNYRDHERDRLFLRAYINTLPVFGEYTDGTSRVIVVANGIELREWVSP
jgi:hypothetical protein